MTNINEYINENIKITSKSKVCKGLDYDDIYDALYSYFENGEDFALDPHGERTGDGKKVLKTIRSIVDVLDFHSGWDEIIDYFDGEFTEDEIVDFVVDNEKQLLKDLIKNL